MRYEFSWKNEGETRTFTSGCPHVAEVMMLNGCDTPRMPAELHDAVRARFGTVRGQLEQFLLLSADRPFDWQSIDSGVPGLSIKIHNDTNMRFVQ